MISVTAPILFGSRKPITVINIPKETNKKIVNTSRNTIVYLTFPHSNNSYFFVISFKYYNVRIGSNKIIEYFLSASCQTRERKPLDSEKDTSWSRMVTASSPGNSNASSSFASGESNTANVNKGKSSFL